MESPARGTLPRRQFEPELFGGIGDLATNGVADANRTVVVEGSAIVAEDAATKAVYEMVERVAKGSINIVLLGEIGVGKSLVAEMVHRLSPRRDSPYVRIACDSLAEAMPGDDWSTEGAPRAAAKASLRDILDRANGGTICLDRIDRLSPALLVELLLALEASESTRNPNVRFLSTTSRDLEIGTGAFPADVFFHLSGASISIPPLRERVQDIIPLAEMFVTRAVDRRLVHRRPDITPEAREVLGQYGWPGNIRELRNVIERALLVCSGSFIRRSDLGFASCFPPAAAPARLAVIPDQYLEPSMSTAPPDAIPGNDRPTDSEKKRILAALTQCNGNQTRAAKMLSMPRRTLVAKLVRYDIPRPRKTNPG